MIQIKTTTKELIGSFKTAGDLIRPTTQPVLENIFVANRMGKIILIADNGEARICVKTRIDCEKPMSVLVPYAIFNKIISNLPDGEVELVFEGTKLQIKHAIGSYDLQTLSDKEFPQDKPFSSEKSMEVDANVFCENVRRVNAFIDESRQDVIRNMMIKSGKSGLLLVGFSNHSGIELEIEKEDLPDIQVLLMKSTAKYIQNSLWMDEQIKILFSDNLIKIEGQDCDLTLTQAQGIYPDYLKLFTEKTENVLELIPTEMIGALKRFSNIADQNTKKIGMELLKDKLSLSYNNIDFSYNAKEEIPVNYSGDEITIHFNVHHFLKAIQNFGEVQHLYIKSKDKPCYVESEKVRGIICPMYQD